MPDKRKNIVVRFGIVYFIISILFLLVIYKIVQIQFFERDEWMKLAEKQKISDITVKPKRGNIFAVDGRLLASSIPTYYVYMDLRVPALNKDDGRLFYENLDSLSLSLSKFFGDKSTVQYKRILLNAFKKQDGNLLLHPKRISYAQLKDLRKLPLYRFGRNRSGLFTREFVRRVKPFGSLASRTIGDVYADEVKGGRSGIEGSFNEQLLGIPGVSTRQKVANKYIETVEVEPVDGLDVYTTLDIEIQDIAEKALRDTIGALGAKSGCIVVMEVQTGEVKAMVNLDYDEKSDSYYEGKNHALTDRMEPGSTFKVASLIAVLDEGKVKINDVFDVGNGVLPIANRLMKDHNYHRGGYGRLHVNEIIQASSNVGVSKMVIKSFADKPEKYIEKLYDLRLNDSLPLQMKGVAKPWIKHPKKDKNEWYKTSLAWISIGYESKIPPIYTLTLFNAIANDGKMVKPLFVKAVKRNEEVVLAYETEVLKQSICKPQTLKEVQQTLKEVVDGKFATAKTAQSKIVRIAGKTGTAQISQGGLGYRAGQTRHNVSFCGYFPADNPKYSAIVVLTAPEGAPSGGRMAGSIFKKVAERTMLMKSSWSPDCLANDSVRKQPYLPEVKSGNSFALKKVVDELALPLENPELRGWVKQTSNEGNLLSLDTYKIQKGLVPDVCGMGVKDAFYMLGALGLDVRVKGRGKVIAQSLKPGTLLREGSIIELELQ
ncbi:MAG: penicillin-binding protein [Paludibacter sp.]|nr:penicillin-binding protein [Paludibacter sp.]MDD4199077.1 penicillin-binding protein [Paludibacter sp.]